MVEDSGWASPASGGNVLGGLYGGAGGSGLTLQRFSAGSSINERSSAEFGTTDRSSFGSSTDGGIEPPDLQRLSIKFVKDTSGSWYRPELTREQAVAVLKNARPGSFVVRNSNSFPGAYALAVRVAELTPSMQTKGDPADGFVRNFLVESTAKGVRLRGNKNEPVFGSLAALIYQHTITPISLPCKLLLPVVESQRTQVLTMTGAVGCSTPQSVTHKDASLAACLVVYVNTVDVETLTGPEAVDRAISITLERMRTESLTTTLAHFKLSPDGITLTDNKHRIFFRRHYKLDSVIYCGLDSRNRRWTQNDVDSKGKLDSRMFGFVSRKPGTNCGNECHVIADYEPEQPAADIVDFVRSVLVSGQGQS
jgi:tensin